MKIKDIEDGMILIFKTQIIMIILKKIKAINIICKMYNN